MKITIETEHNTFSASMEYSTTPGLVETFALLMVCAGYPPLAVSEAMVDLSETNPIFRLPLETDETK